MAIDYERRLQNLQARRFDKELNESVLTKSFSSTSIPKNIKYLMESMVKIDKKYNDRTLEAAKRVQKHLENGYDLHFSRAYRTQGSVTTSTNIKVHSDFDLLTIIDRYHFNGIGVPNNNPYTDSEPNSDIKKLRSQSEKIMDNIYDEVDKSGKKNISIFNKSLNRKVDIVFCFWFNSKKYEDTLNEYYRGVYLFDFTEDERILDYPFAHISQVNTKGDNTNDGSRKGIRLLKTLKADNEEIDLSSFHLTTIVHSIQNSELYFLKGKEIDIAKAISNQLQKLINDPEYRRNVESPNGTEKPLKDDTIDGMKTIKSDLDELIADVHKELYLGYFQKGELIYS
ncbi:hypothetical protein [Mangrovivirga cuniculi]|uniref:Nucleotidyltransferase n=1 Tax=Mangrovivirga cuniculi TaxID=2715131 RepID=A0A4D7JTT3_9BACT|nr:hypothetical protein [Mangrovivirga cuniculi]QCK15566.1 hypothetical protein DCC35_12825 [Mangrovivirga cuniculi]